MASTPDAAAAATCGHASAGDGELLGTGNVAEDGVRRRDAESSVCAGDPHLNYVVVPVVWHVMFFVPGEIFSCRATSSFCILTASLMQAMLQANGVVESCVRGEGP